MREFPDGELSVGFYDLNAGEKHKFELVPVVDSK